MSRIRIGGPLLIPDHTQAKWFEQVSPDTMYERDLEGKVLAHAPTIYPDYHVLPFKRDLYSGSEVKRADLIFIARDYRDWHIVEVETSDHDLPHVEAQVAVFSQATLSNDDIAYLCAQDKTLDALRCENLIKTSVQGVLIILNARVPNTWPKSLSKYDAQVSVFELFRTADGLEIFRVDGSYPSAEIESFSLCEVHSHLGDRLIIRNPLGMHLPLHTIIKILHNNCWTYWEREDVNGIVMLRLVGKSFMKQKDVYRLIRLRQQALVLVRQEPRKTTS